jgi:hypothetical protein
MITLLVALTTGGVHSHKYTPSGDAWASFVIVVYLCEEFNMVVLIHIQHQLLVVP